MRERRRNFHPQLFNEGPALFFHVENIGRLDTFHHLFHGSLLFLSLESLKTGFDVPFPRGWFSGGGLFG